MLTAAALGKAPPPHRTTLYVPRVAYSQSARIFGQGFSTDIGRLHLHVEALAPGQELRQHDKGHRAELRLNLEIWIQPLEVAIRDRVCLCVLLTRGPIDFYQYASFFELQAQFGQEG